MNKKAIFMFLVFLALIQLGKRSYAQFSRDIINYQGAVRNTNGTPAANTRITVRIGFSNTSSGNDIEYWEVWGTTTNALGMYRIQIGASNPIASGPILFTQINWNTDYKYLKVEIDVNGGNQFANSGIVQLSAVPYAYVSEFAKRTKELEEGQEGDILFYKNGKATFFSPFSQQIVLVDDKTIKGKGTTDAPFEVGILDTEHISDEAITPQKIKPGEDYEVLRTGVGRDGKKTVTWDKGIYSGNIWLKIQNNLTNPTFDIPELPATPNQISIYRNGVQLLGRKSQDEDPVLYKIEEGKLTVKTDGFQADDGTIINKLSTGDIIEVKWIR